MLPMLVSPLGCLLACALAQEVPQVADVPDVAIQAAATEELPPRVFAERRARLLEKLGRDATVVLFAAPVRERNHDVNHPYRQASNFWYLTGFPEPDAVALLWSDESGPRCALFVPEFDPLEELWNGRRIGVEGARAFADESLGLSGLDAAMKARLDGRTRVLADFGGDERARERLASWLAKGAEVDDEEAPRATGRLRLVKGPEELALLQRSIDITCAALVNAMRHGEAGMHEFEIQGVIEATYALLGSPRLGFPSIVGSGRNSCILHYDTNRELVPPDRTIVMDVGAEYGMYSADVTRTVPTNGRFTPEQRVVYQAVLDAQEAGIAEAKPGSTIERIQRAARSALGEALLKGGVIQSKDQARALLPHGTCHWLGLDVHDQCPYRGEDGGGAVVLAPGMVTTIEPGCYIPAGTAGVDPKWHEIGVRIEDDVLITEDGCVVMSLGAPRTIEEIERRMAEPSPFPRLLPGAKRP